MPGKIENLQHLPYATKLIRGYKNKQLVGQYVFSSIMVPRERFEWINFGPDSFRYYDTLRALGGPTNKGVKEVPTYTEGKLEEHDFAFKYDRREVRAAQDYYDLRGRLARNAMKILQNDFELTCMDLVTTPGNYPAGHATDKTGSELTTALTTVYDFFDALFDPIEDATTQRPNLIVVGNAAHRVIRRNATLRADFRTTIDRNFLTESQIAQALEVDNYVVAKRQYVDPADNTKKSIWGNIIAAFYISPAALRAMGLNGRVEADDDEPSMEDPSFGYNFKLTDGTSADEYQDADAPDKNWWVRSTDFWKPTIVGSSAGALYYNATA